MVVPVERAPETESGFEGALPRPRRPGLAAWLFPLLLTLAGMGGLAYWWRTEALSWSTLAGLFAGWPWLVLGVLALLLPLGLHSLRYYFLLRRMAPVPFGFVVQMVLACTFLNHFVVAKVGDFAEPLWLQERTQVTYWRGLQVGLIRFGHSMGGLLLLASLMVGAWATLWLAFPWNLLGQAPVLLTLLAMGLVVWQLPWVARQAADWKPSWPTPASSPLGRRLQGLLTRLQLSLQDLIQASSLIPRRAHLAHVGLAWAELAADGLPYVCFALAAGVSLGSAPILTAATTLNLIEYLPTPPALLGVQSWVAAASLHPAAEVTPSLAAGVLMHRSMRTLLIALLGAWPSFCLGRPRAKRT